MGEHDELQRLRLKIAELESEKELLHKEHAYELRRAYRKLYVVSIVMASALTALVYALILLGNTGFIK